MKKLASVVGLTEPDVPGFSAACVGAGVLVGETLMRSPDPKATVHALLGRRERTTSLRLHDAICAEKSIIPPLVKVIDPVAVAVCSILILSLVDVWHSFG